MANNPSTEQTASDLADQAAESADAVIQSARTKAHDALDGLSERMQTVKDKTTATFERLRPQLDSVASYAKEEPAKALLIAAAAGAGVMAIVALMARSGGGQAVPSTKSLRKAAAESSGSWARAAADKADEWQKTANEKAEYWRKAAADAADSATDTADSVMKSTRGAAKAAYEGLSETVQQWRDQAAPIVDRIKPQIDAVTGYAKDDPGKALLIAAAAGAALMGLMSTLNR